MKKANRFLAVLLALVLLCTLAAGCSAQKSIFDAGDGSTAPQATPQAAPTEQCVFLKEPLSVGENSFYDIGAFVAAQGKLWSVGSSHNAQGDVEHYLVSLSQNEDGTVETDTVPLQLPEFSMEQAPEEYITGHDALIPAPDGQMYSLDYCRVLMDPEDWGDDQFYCFLSKLDTASGLCSEPQSLDLPHEGMPTSQPCLAGDTLYMLWTDAIYTVSSKGKSGRLPLPNFPQDLLDSMGTLGGQGAAPEPVPRALQPLADGKLLLYAMVNGGAFNGDQICLLDPTDNSMSEWITINGLEGGDPINLITGADGTCWMWNTTGVYHLDPATGKATLASRWQDSAIDPATLYGVQPLADGAFLATLMPAEPTGPYTLDFAVLKPTSAAELGDRTVITVGLAGSDDAIRDYIKAFNASSADLSIEVKNYDTGDVDTTAEAIAADLLDHTMPDILLLSNGMNLESYIQKGLFLDMFPLLDADSELSRQNLVPCVLAACAHGDTLPTITPNFAISTLSGPTALVGETAGWTPQQLLALQQSQGCDTPILRAPRGTVLLWLTIYGGKSLINYETATCDLDSDAFIQLLELSAAYPESYADISTDPIKDRIDRGEGFLADEYLYSFYNLRGAQYIYNGPATYIGFPNADGRCGAVLNLNVQAAISSYCQDPDAAWQVIRGLLLPQGQRTLTQNAAGYYNSFPARMDLLQEMADAAQQPQPVGATKQLPGYMYTLSSAGNIPAIDPQITEDDDELWTRPLTADEVEQFMRLIREIDGNYKWNGTVSDILQEEAAYYYNGQRTAEETAKIIQDRVQTYLSEQS